MVEHERATFKFKSGQLVIRVLLAPDICKIYTVHSTRFHPQRARACP